MSLITSKKLTSTLDPKVVSAELCQYLEENLLAPGIELSAEKPLKEVGIDSIALMDLVLFFERQYQVTFSHRMVDARKYRKREDT